MSAPRNALGRGLGALLPPAQPRTDAANAIAQTLPQSTPRSDEIPRIPVALIDANPDQPRRLFDADRLAELAGSISQSGLLQPVVVRRAGDRYELIVGERRWRAAKQAGLAAIPAVVADVAAEDRLALAIVENVQREDLNPIELAAAYRALAGAGATQEEIGRRVGKDRSSVANHLRLLELSVDIQEDVETGRLSMGHAKALLQVGEPEARQRLRDRVLSERLSVRETEQLGREIAGPVAARSRKPRAKSSEAAASSNPHLKGLADLLERHFQSRVRILGGASSGRLEIEYASSEDLDRITRLILEGL
ncbi:MAG: ParB/RepB/Spo0J family partition protein [Myxococcota bacterium]|nr:ParB/RepB/Spo0J family partition protein [Myxococcota bacterium]